MSIQGKPPDEPEIPETPAAGVPAGTSGLPMFPLGSVLFPYMPLQLRVFEERYLIMLASILESEPAEFGVVLIERGQEVGGGEHRFSTGTVAQVLELVAPEGFVGLVAQGDRRIEVVEWSQDTPFPQAVVRELPALVWDDALTPLRVLAEQTVRRTLSLASEFTDDAWSANVALSEDPVEAAWQLAGIAPVGPLDQVEMLRSTTMAGLLRSIFDCTEAAADAFRVPGPGDLDADDLDADDLNPDDPDA
ncbi:LON peptidase substrate-binding domain-containing protein [Cryobacterium lactosi]|nr:LON peptidase substrate-binding domain-containing protein [Cryobacterium lactosi]